MVLLLLQDCVNNLMESVKSLKKNLGEKDVSSQDNVFFLVCKLRRNICHNKGNEKISLQARIAII